LFSLVKTRQESKLDIFEQRMRTSIDRRLTSESHKLELISEKLKALDPTLLLARGYSITMHNGHAVKDASSLAPGTEIETRLAKGTIHSIIK
jgi:exodeoxyribonuclease VII large subunit